MLHPGAAHPIASAQGPENAHMGKAHKAPKTHTWALPMSTDQLQALQTALWLGPAVSPVALSLHLSIVGAVDDDLDDLETFANGKNTNLRYY